MFSGEATCCICLPRYDFPISYSSFMNNAVCKIPVERCFCCNFTSISPSITGKQCSSSFFTMLTMVHTDLFTMLLVFETLNPLSVCILPSSSHSMCVLFADLINVDLISSKASGLIKHILCKSTQYLTMASM